MIIGALARLVVELAGAIPLEWKPIWPPITIAEVRLVLVLCKKILHKADGMVQWSIGIKFHFFRKNRNFFTENAMKTKQKIQSNLSNRLHLIGMQRLIGKCNKKAPEGAFEDVWDGNQMRKLLSSFWS